MKTMALLAILECFSVLEGFWEKFGGVSQFHPFEVNLDQFPRNDLSYRGTLGPEAEGVQKGQHPWP